MSAAEQWRNDLAAWDIPEAILAAAPESPWGFSPEVFARRADMPPAQPTPSTLRALEALPEGGSVLDIGCGAGAASLPLAARAGALAGVDASAAMLEAFRERVTARGLSVQTAEGNWPEAAGAAPLVDVVVCHHVFYNVPDLAPFVRALSDHARARVVVELPERHPISALNPLWLRFHGLVRPTVPTVDTALAVLREAGITPEHEWWEPGVMGWVLRFGRRADLVAWARRRLCLPAARDDEIAEALAPRLVEQDGFWALTPQHMATIWWPGANA